MRTAFAKASATVLMVIFSAFACAAQDKLRIVEKGVQYPNQPIEVVGRQLGEKPFMDESRVFGDQDWLKQLILTVKNTSDKNIFSFDIDLLIKKDEKVLMGIPIHFRTYTKPTPENALTLKGEQKLGVLQPAEIVKVRVSDRVLPTLMNELRKYGIVSPERITIDIRGVYFEDKTRWMFGQDRP